MSPLQTLLLVINGVCIALDLVLLALVLWRDSRSSANLAFAAIILMMVIWIAGTSLARITAAVGELRNLTDVGVRMIEIGLTGVCVSVYLYATLLTGGQRRIYWMVVGVAAIGLLMQIAVTFSNSQPTYDIRPDRTLAYRLTTFSMLLYGSFVAVALFIIWQRRRKVASRLLVNGIIALCLSLLTELFSPQLRSQGVSLTAAAISLLILGYATVREQIMEPLAGRGAQLQAVRDVGLAITSRLRLEDALHTIATQAATILNADGAAIFLNNNDALELAAVYNMSEKFIGHRLALGEGVVGKVAISRQSSRIEDYRRDWSGTADMPFAKQSFGSVVAAPLIIAEEVVGVIFVVAGATSKRFDRDDLNLLDLLGPQAAVAISNSRLFERRQGLTIELESAKNQLETLLMSTENPVIALNRRLDVIFANFAANDLFQQQLQPGVSLLSMDLRGIIPPHPRAALRKVLRWRLHTYEITIDGRTYMCHLGLLGRAKAQGYVVVMNDISELKELDRLKNQMIRMTSHDLKNPLSAAMMNTELLLEEGGDALNEDLRHYATTIMVQLERMSRITRGILDMERIQSGTPIVEDCDAAELLKMTVHEFDSYATRNDVTISAVLPTDIPLFPADRTYLTRALANLAENAIKFTRRGGSVVLGAEQANGQVIFHVADTGVGIPAEAQSRIFDRFFRVTQPGMEQVSGTGLGLSLVKSVADIHHGHVWFESAVGQGTTFHLALPLRPMLPTEWRRAIE